jgi:predicted alpha/beta superfamily hydrolase
MPPRGDRHRGLIFSPMRLLATAALAGGLATSPAAQPRPYVLDHTEVRPIRSQVLARDYELYVALPPSYATSTKAYPVVFVTDAAYAFPLVRSIAGRITRHTSLLQEFILVGISYGVGEEPRASRNRDYTPTDAAQKNTRESDQGPGPYGQAEAFRRFVAGEVFPLVARSYRADMANTVYMGHSYGSLFGLHVLLTQPTLFRHYVLGSPSLWYDRRHVFSAERSYAAAHKDLPARVLMVLGAFETVSPGAGNPRFHKRNDMVRDARAFEAQLRGRRYPGLSVRTEVIAGEDHATVFPAIATRGLLWALPAAP